MRRDAVDAADRAERRAPFRRQELAADVVDRVRRRAARRAAALLRAPVHEPVLADVEIACAGAALPVVRLAVGKVHLEAADAGVEVLEDLSASVDPPHHVVEHRALVRAERLEEAGAVVDDADRGGEAELRGAVVDRARVFRVLDAAADHRVDVDVEVGVFGQPLQLLVEQPQALLRDFVRLDVVDADLEVVEPGLVERLDALAGTSGSRW